jgi:hypothetical protein
MNGGLDGVGMVNDSEERKREVDIVTTVVRELGEEQS